uniref:Uncharacterized protein n=1 Tax=Aegilops tauschii subsp. strangulata TaxID=200361 RepID=A0A453TAR4_AEGTS
TRGFPSVIVTAYWLAGKTYHWFLQSRINRRPRSQISIGIPTKKMEKLHLETLLPSIPSPHSAQSGSGVPKNKKRNKEEENTSIQTNAATETIER